MLAFCDYIAHTIKQHLRGVDNPFVDEVVASVGSIKLDLHEQHGYFLSTKKTLDVTDINGKVYRITVEEV